MRNKFIRLSFLVIAAVITGCQSGVTNIAVSRNSEMGQAIASLDEAKRQYQKNVEVYKQAMMDYEKTHGDTCGHIMFSSIVGPLLASDEPRVHIYRLQGSSRGCGYQNYRAKIFYSDDACRMVKSVEILERMPPQ